MHDLVLIKKIDASYGCWSNLIRKKKIPDLSVEQILNKYNGFEGDLISITSIKENKKELEEIDSQYEKFKSSDNYLLLHLFSEPNPTNINLQQKAFFLGYDVGVCQGEQSIYSSIFNEILFGIVDELIVFKNCLNENLLLQNRNLAENYVKVHNEMSVQGKDVEDYMEMIIYEVWKHKD